MTAGQFSAQLTRLESCFCYLHFTGIQIIQFSYLIIWAVVTKQMGNMLSEKDKVYIISNVIKYGLSDNLHQEIV